MRGGRGKLPVLAEISDSASSSPRAWSLRREDLQALAKLQKLPGEPGVVLVCGDRAAAGAIALAGVAGAGGRSTALVECDLVWPRLAVGLGLSPTPGLHEYLRWEATAGEILQPLALAGPASGRAAHPLVCIVAGRPAGDPTTLIGLESFGHALAKLRRAYDLVVLAGPAIDSGFGSLGALAVKADALLAAVSPGAVGGRQGRALRSSLSKLPVAVEGAIVVG